MNRILKIFFGIVFLLFLFSCNNEDMETLTISEEGSAVITAPETGYTFVLNPEETLTNPALTITWDSAEYGVPTGITYVVEFALTGTNFENPYNAGETTYNYYTWSITELNGIAINSGLSPFVEGNVDVRIVSYVGTNKSMPQYSSPITLNLTPFTTDLPKLAVPGNHQGWDPSTAPLIASAGYGLTNYEGYMWLDGQFKFVAPNETGGFFWGNTDWGDASGVDGSYTQVLVETGEGNCNAATAGYYFVQADTDELTYKITYVNWGIIGVATPTGWDSDTDLIYNSSTRTLSVDIDLVPGEFKFRGNNEWAQFDLGTVDSDGYLQNGGNLTFDGPAGNYHVVLDLSNPREYTYTVTPN